MQASTIVGSIALILALVLIAGYAKSQDAPELKPVPEMKAGVEPKPVPEMKPVPEAKPIPEVKTMQKKVDEREAVRRAAVAEQEKRKQEFARRCSKPLKTAEELAECRAVYRQM